MNEQHPSAPGPVLGAARTRRAGIRSLALGFPSILRTNDYWRSRYPTMVERAELFGLAAIWLRQDGSKRSAFDEVMDPYRSDPFLGAVERRVRAPDETALSMEVRAARGALAAAGLGAADIGLTLVSSFVGDRLGVGNAAYLAAELGLPGPAINYESACSGSLVGLRLASHLVASGAHDRVMVVSSTSNSVQVRDDDSVGWFVGDGAAAMIIEPAAEGFGVLGGHVFNSVETNDMFVIQSFQDGEDGTRFETLGTPRSGAIAKNTAEPYLHRAVAAAVADAGVPLSAINFFVFNTPTAWYADFCARELGISSDKYLSIYPRYGNVGAVLAPAALYHALEERKVAPGDLVLLYSIGSTSTAAAMVLRVGDVALGPFPTKPTHANADLPASPAAAPEPVVEPPLAPLARRAIGRAPSAELRAMVERSWGAEPPASVSAAIAAPERVGAESLAERFVFEHHVPVADGRTVFVRERFTMQGLLSSPRRAVLLLPGPLCRESIYEIDVDGYRLQSALADDGFFVYSLEYTGVGRSSSPADGRSARHALLVEDARAALRYVRALRWLSPVDVLGESNGAAIATELANDDGDVRSCVLSAVLFEHGTRKFKHVFQSPAFLSFLSSIPGGYLEVSAPYYSNILANSSPAVSKAVLATQPGRYAIAPLLEPRVLPWYDPTRAKVPALVLQGALDNIALPSDLPLFAAAYGSAGGGRATPLALSGAGHIPRLEPRPIADRWLAEVLRFLRSSC
jgi:3-oxoacyl-[acyl-carrier-protein] synthase-3